MKKTFSIDLGSDRLLSMADDMISDHNYIGALKMLNKNSELNGDDPDSLALYAEAFDDMGLNERSVNFWFRFYDCISVEGETHEDLTDFYEGLAVSYMHLGNKGASALYYNKLIDDVEALDPEEKSFLLDSFLGDEPDPLKFVYPPEIADCSEVLSEGARLMREGNYNGAIAEFESVAAENPSYLTARNYIAICKILSDDAAEAERECEAVLEKNPDCIQILTTLAAVKNEKGDYAASREIAKKLLSVKDASAEDCYKIASVCCENKMHAEAYKLFCKVEEELPYDKSLLYFKAVSAFNASLTQEAFDTFDKLLTIYPEAYVARRVSEMARAALSAGIKTELSYFYQLPTEERDAYMAQLFGMNGHGDEVLPDGSVTDEEALAWCFDEVENSAGIDLEYFAAERAVRLKMDGLVSDLLLDAFSSDDLKVYILGLIAMRNENNDFGVVFCHFYRNVNFYRLDIGRNKRKYFLRAYSALVSHFGFLDKDNSLKFKFAAEKLYGRMERGERLRLASDVRALTSAIYDISGVVVNGIDNSELRIFSDDCFKIAAIRGEL